MDFNGRYLSEDEIENILSFTDMKNYRSLCLTSKSMYKLAKDFYVNIVLIKVTCNLSMAIATPGDMRVRKNEIFCKPHTEASLRAGGTHSYIFRTKCNLFYFPHKYSTTDVENSMDRFINNSIALQECFNNRVTFKIIKCDGYYTGVTNKKGQLQYEKFHKFKINDRKVDYKITDIPLNSECKKIATTLFTERHSTIEVFNLDKRYDLKSIDIFGETDMKHKIEKIIK